MTSLDWILISKRIETTLNWRIHFAQENLALAREATEQDLIADELDIDHGMVVPSKTNVQQIAPIKKLTRQCYSASQLEILNCELENGTARYLTVN